MSGKGNCYDNSMAETFFKSIKAELIWRNRWETRRQAEGAIFNYISGVSNPRRHHSSLGGKSPLAFEQKATSMDVDRPGPKPDKNSDRQVPMPFPPIEKGFPASQFLAHLPISNTQLTSLLAISASFERQRLNQDRSAIRTLLGINRTYRQTAPIRLAAS